MTDQETLQVTKDMTMGEIIQKYPDSTEIMESYGLHCFGCHVNVFETLEQGVLGHGMTDEALHGLLDDLNKMAAGVKVEKKAVEISEPMLISESAAVKLKELLSKEDKKYVGIRVSVVKGGCAGYMYNMDFASQVNSNDTVLEKNGATVIIDKDTLDILHGTEIDYVETLQGAGFKFNNPNAKGSCGCGKSYH